MSVPSNEELIQGADSLKQYLSGRYDIKYITIGIGKDKLVAMIQNDYFHKAVVKHIEKDINEWVALNTSYILVDIRKIGKIVMN